MITRYERHLLLTYAANIGSNFPHHSPMAAAVACWIGEFADELRVGGFRCESDEPCDESDHAGKQADIETSCSQVEIRFLIDERGRVQLSQGQGESHLSCQEWEAIKAFLRREVAGAGEVNADPMATRIRELGRIVQMSSTDVAILELLLRYETQPLVESIIDSALRHMRRRRLRLTLRNRVLPDLLGLSYGGFCERLSPSAPLVRSGLVSVDDDGDLELIDRLKRLSLRTSDSTANVGQLLFGAAPPSELEWSDFDHIAQMRDHVERLIKGALKTNATGVNVLVYGPPGTGKTQFCRTLADRLGAALHSVGETDDVGTEPARVDRLHELKLAQHVFGKSDNTLLLFDEMEDLLASPVHLGTRSGTMASRSRIGSEGSKIYMNRMLERNAVPTLWTSNSARSTCPTVLRRMMFALELRNPSRKVRARIWAGQLARHGIESDGAQADALAREFDVTPGLATGATAGAGLVEGGGMEAVRLGVRSLSRLMSGDRPLRRDPTGFDPALVRADVEPASLADRMARWGARRVSLCLSGPSGTGKSAFVRYLAERMGLEVVQKRASDLLSMWVGETEELIAAAFAEAREDRHFLVFDEADSLLADRRFAHRSWEVSQVNEMLTWMESHPLPFACTTNFGERLDVATLRRFDFKIVLGYLTPDQVRTAFRSFFGLGSPPELDAISSLTPGDFAAVHRRAEVLGCLANPSALVGMLREECDAKPEHRTKIGFGG